MMPVAEGLRGDGQRSPRPTPRVGSPQQFKRRPEGGSDNGVMPTGLDLIACLCLYAALRGFRYWLERPRRASGG
jgi:hypothetical protein